MKDTNKREHGKLIEIFDTHRSLSQSEKYEWCMWTHCKHGAMRQLSILWYFPFPYGL